MIGKDRHELVAIFRQQQCVDRAVREGSEGFIGRGKYREWTFAL